MTKFTTEKKKRWDLKKNEGKSNLKIGRKKFGLRKSQLLQKKFNQKEVMKVLLLLMRTKVELEREDNTQNLGKKEQKILKTKVETLRRKRLSWSQFILMEMVQMLTWLKCWKEKWSIIVQTSLLMILLSFKLLKDFFKKLSYFPEWCLNSSKESEKQWKEFYCLDLQEQEKPYLPKQLPQTICFLTSQHQVWPVNGKAILKKWSE